MKSVMTYAVAGMLLIALLLTAVSCQSSGGGIETYPPGEEAATTALPLDDATAPATPTDTSDPVETNEADSSKAPDFTVLDKDGNQVKLSDFFGKPIVLNFWASWCPPCKSELPDFEEMYKRYEGKVIFLMVNLTDGQRETVDVAKSFIASAGYTFPVYFDTTYEASTVYGIRSIPQTYFIDAEGNPVAYATGMISGSQLEEGIRMIYSE